MAIWHGQPTLEMIERINAETLDEHLGIVFTAIGDDWLSATMPVDRRTVQPGRLLHGGASVVLSESLGSIGAALTVDLAKFRVAGLEINANHLRGVREHHGPVTGTARPLHRGQRTQVWQTEVRDPAGKLVCVSRLTVAVVPIGE